MLKTGKKWVHRLVRSMGYQLIPLHHDTPAFPLDFDSATIAIYQRVAACTMTSKERIFALVQAVAYLNRCGIDGALVECGVWAGGSMMAAALQMLADERTDRDLYLFDTYTGMPEPEAVDRNYNGESAGELMAVAADKEGTGGWCVSSMAQVKQNLSSCQYPVDRMHFVQGMVEQTIPDQAPARIALLRLDTDWYASTRHELEHLFPRLAVGGVLIVDDYGYWAGSRKAVDEYIQRHDLPLLLDRIDATGRIAVKQTDHPAG